MPDALQVRDGGVTIRCERPGCKETFAKHERPNNYCSARCFYEEQGEDVLKKIRHDHRLCYACFRQTTEVAPPRETDPEFVIGYKYLTEHGRIGEKAVSPGASDRVRTGVICTCGTTSHDDAYLRDLDLADAVKRFFDVFVALRDDGQLEGGLEGHVLLEELRRRPSNWAYAIGRARHAAET